MSVFNNSSSCIYRLLLVIWTTLISTLSIAQEVDYILDDKIEGKAYYSRKGSTNQKNGPFYFVSFFQDSFDLDFYLKYELKGNYLENKKSDDWQFEFNRLTPQGEYNLESLKFTELASGERYSIQGAFENGIFSEKWRITESSVQYSDIQDTSSTCTFHFNEGRIYEAFSINYDLIQVNGEVDKEGFLHGEVTYTFSDEMNEMEDVRTFKHGRLIENKLTVNGNVVKRDFLGLIPPSDTAQNYVELSIGDQYLEMMRLCHTVKPQQQEALEEEFDKMRLALDAVLLTSLKSLTHHNGVAIWPGQPTFEYPKIKLVEQPYSDIEEKAIDEINDGFKKLTTQINKVVKDDQLVIAANANQKILLYQSVYAFLNNNVLPFYESYINLLNNPGLKYLDRAVLFSEIKELREFPKAISIEELDTTIYLQSPDFQAPGMTTELLASMNSTLRFIDSLETVTRPIIEKEKQLLSLTEDEILMVVLRDSINELFSDKENNEYQKRFAFQVKKVVNNRFKAYAQLDIDKKVNQLSEINQCFNTVLDFYFLLAELPQKSKSIEELYTRTVWNPFTYTDMDEIVKERVYKAYNSIVLPALLDSAENNLDCNHLPDILLDFSKLFEKMESLREQDTSVLEKKLRRENDPVVIVQLLELKLSLF
jgi:hypothetical protein